MDCRTLSPVQRFNALAMRMDWPTRADDVLAFDHARLTDLHRIWSDVRGAKTLPQRGDFSARTLMRHLKEIAFLERVPGPETARGFRFRYGFYGSALARYTGDCTGKYLEEVIPPQNVESWYAGYGAALAQMGPLRFVTQFDSFNLEYLTAECIAAPLGDAQGEPCGALFSIAFAPRVS